MLPWGYLLRRLIAHADRKRLERATLARGRPLSFQSEARSFALLTVVSLVAGYGFVLGGSQFIERGDQLYALALSIACLFNFAIFLIRFQHFDGALADVCLIDNLRRKVREGPPIGEVVHMHWKGPKPANEF